MMKCRCKELLFALCLSLFLLLPAAQAQPSTVNPLSTTVAQVESNCLSPSSADQSPAAIQPSSIYAPISGSVLPNVKNGTASPVPQQVSQSLDLSLKFVFKIRNQDQFAKCRTAISEPSSPDYGHFLNATSLQPYIPTPGKKSSVKSFFTSVGFTVKDDVSPIVIDLSAPVSMVQQVLHITFAIYRGGNLTFYASNSDPSLPQNIASLTSGILGLDNSTQTRISSINHPCTNSYCPQGLQAGYDLSTLYAEGYNGKDETVAVLVGEDDANPQTAINTFSSEFGLPQSTLKILTLNNLTLGSGIEGDLDMESVHALAPGAQIVLVREDDLFGALDYIAANHVAPIVTASIIIGVAGTHFCDSDFPSSQIQSLDQRLALDAAQGLTMLFGTGDDGAQPDGTHFCTHFPASDPNVLAVGATNLNLIGCNTNTCTGYGSETAWSDSSGGYSTVFAEPSWQLSTIGTTPGRGVPDIAMFGGPPGIWAYHSLGNCGNVCGWFSAYGTSLATPLWAGLIAVALQVRGGSGFGNLEPLLYQLASSPSYCSLFHDITSGSNGYSANPGWDPATGWGSPIAYNLISALSHVVQPSLSMNGCSVIMNVSSTILGGGTPSAPKFNYVAGGSQKSLTLKTTAVSLAVDVGSSWSVTPHALSGSSASQRWFSNQPLIGTASATTLTFVFYHQTWQKLSYSVKGGGFGYSPPVFQANQFGSSTPITLSTTPTGYWFDYGSTWTLTPNPLSGSSASERWITSQATSGKIGGSNTLVFTYQNQFYLTMQLTPTGNGTVSPSTNWFNAAQKVTIRATAKTGYKFLSWTGNGAGSYTGPNSSTIITMTAPITETANFGKVNS